ncbi:MAG: HD domain-containing protein [bacterium]
MRCPGQDTRYWKAGDIFEIPCPSCGHQVEFFKDESSRKCKNCGHMLLNPKMDFGCATYCKFAEQCLGSLPPEVMAQREELLKNRVALEMKRYFKKDFKRIGHATKVARYAEQILKQEKGDLAVVLSAAYLHDIGIKDAEHIYQSSSAEYQEELGPSIAQEILERLGAKPEMIEEVCDIISHHHHPRPKETDNFKALFDADLVANMEEKHKKSPVNRKELIDLINRSFFTATGKMIAEKIVIIDKEHVSESLKK